MKQTSVFLVPGYTGSGPQHWQTLWEQKCPEYRRVVQRDWDNPLFSEWIETLNKTVSSVTQPIILVGHSLGCITIVHWANLYKQKIKAALLVAPTDVELASLPFKTEGFNPIPLEKLPFKSIVVASSNDPVVSQERARFFSKCWGSQFVDVGPCGHINTNAGLGYWPEGEKLLQTLKNL